MRTVLVLAILGVFLAACITPGAATANCPTPTSETQLLNNPAHGYCLLFPKEYKSEQPNPNETVLYVGSLTDVQHPRVYIEVVVPSAKTPAQAADEALQDMPPGLTPARQTISFAGEPAVQLDNLPGQDIRRMIFASHNGRLYTLTFVPADPADAAFADMVKLHALITQTFRFI